MPDDLASAPRAAVVRLAGQLQVDPDVIRSYGRRAKTRTDHLRLVMRYLRWRPAGELELKELDEFLLARAMEHDSPTLLFRLACEYLISARVIRPGPVTVVKRVAHARATNHPSSGVAVVSSSDPSRVIILKKFPRP